MTETRDTTKAKNNKCVVCRETVRTNQRALECDGCKLWAHLKCVNVSEKLWKLINEREPMDGAKWFCASCLPSLNQFDQIKQTQQNLDDKLDNLHSLMLRLEKRQTEFDKRVENIENLIEEKVEELFEERVDKDRRKGNVIIQGLKESKDSDPNKRKEHDIGEVKKIAKFLEVSVDITACMRLGTKTAKKTRPLKVVLSSVKNRADLIRNSKEMRNAEAKYSKVFINPDLTPREREVDKKLVTELKKKRQENPDEHWIIRRGRITKTEGTVQSRPRKPETDASKDDSGDDRSEDGSDDEVIPLRNANVKPKNG